MALLLCVACYELFCQELPAVRVKNGASQLIVQGKPFLVLGGELGNSSAGTAEQADTILPRLAALHFNTVLMPVAWDEIEPEEGKWDFSVPDHWIEVARREKLRLVILWFGSWKNSMSEYAPAWVLSDTKRFPREITSEGVPVEILSPLGEETARCDAKAFAALMRHLREVDEAQQTVLMVQVENELGFLGPGGRDRSARANELFVQAVPEKLVKALTAKDARLTGRVAEDFHASGKTWAEMFGGQADEVFMAWHYGLFANQVAEAGKKEYALPMYMNAQLPVPFERSGEYPGGGPHPEMQTIYRAAAPGVDFYAPDIYWPDFEHWVDWYRAQGNAAFVPEARMDVAPYNALYLYGEARGFGFSPFAVDSLPEKDATGKAPALSEEYAALDAMSGMLLDAQAKDATRALVLHKASLRGTRTVALGGFLFKASLLRTWPGRELATDDGAMLIVQTRPKEFYVLGSGLTVSMTRDPDVDGQMAGIAGIAEMKFADGKWSPVRVLNGDQNNQGRELSMDAHGFRVYRVRLYTYSTRN
ncbi:DUF5597 domain-containing protein [Acidicapsa dinghuensis]|uniref:DUF5597 domain-containing protein n=1 Tax=Acidicapsa dinghuensis TaxID=2218256 RepID=A0ABW1ENQ4_9BACT|nr:DUF5597 domain-containing protein [Acidicapsa dinghuensis]